MAGGPGWIRTSEGVSQQIYSLPRLATSVPTQVPLLPAAARDIISQAQSPVKLGATSRAANRPSERAPFSVSYTMTTPVFARSYLACVLWRRQGDPVLPRCRDSGLLCSLRPLVMAYNLLLH